ncbi:MAG TPA: transporter substrate-binding domain-containing protein, partial [Opitutaceae bacterium]|nr:transporter substrate-binding domain-containing protein [Opitutaceae bacterium]
MLICLCLSPGLWINLRAEPTPTPDASPSKPGHVYHVILKSDSYPYSFTGDSGQASGFAVDLLDAVARVMNFKVSYHRNPSTAEINRWNSNGESTIRHFCLQTTERNSYLEFSVPYLTLPGAFFVRSDDTRFSSFDDLCAKHARIAAGHAGQNYALQHGISKALINVTSNEKALRLLEAGDCDAVLLSRLSGLSLINHFGFHNIRVGSSLADDSTMRFGFAVAHGNEPILAQLNEGLAILHRTGEFDQIYGKWFDWLEPRKFSFHELIAYVAATLAVVLLVTLWALMRQQQLRRRIARQARELIESKSILAEAQQFARIGHWQRPLDPNAPIIWSEETYHIFERDPRL